MTSNQAQPKSVAETSVEVVVKSMPPAEQKPLLHDTNRMISLAAFIFSLSTGVFSLYHTLSSDRSDHANASLSFVQKYYELDEKRTSASATAPTEIVLSEQRSVALWAYREAKKAPDLIDATTWGAIGEINDIQNLEDSAGDAWSRALQLARTPNEAVWAMSGLAYHDVVSGDTKKGRTEFAQIEQMLKNGGTIGQYTIKPIADYHVQVTRVNDGLIVLRAATSRDECEVVIPAYTDAQKALHAATAETPDFDAATKSQVSSQLIFQIANFEPVFNSCKQRQKTGTLVRRASAPHNSNQICVVLSQFVTASQNGFALLQGPETLPGLSRASPISFPGSKCDIFGSNSVVCAWSNLTQQQAFTKLAFLLNGVRSCNLLHIDRQTTSTSEDKSAATPLTQMTLDDGDQVTLGVNYNKYSDAPINYQTKLAFSHIN